MANTLRSLGTGLFEGLTENIEEAKKNRLIRAQLEGQITGAGGTVPQRPEQSGIRKLLETVGLANQGGPNIEDLIRLKTQQAAQDKKRKRQQERFKQIIDFVEKSSGEIDPATAERLINEAPQGLGQMMIRSRIGQKNKKIQATGRFTQIVQDPESSRKDKIKAIIGLKRLKGETLSREDVFGKQQRGTILPQGSGFIPPGETRPTVTQPALPKKATPLDPTTEALRKAQTDAAKALAEQRRSPVSKAVTMGQLGTSLNAVLRLKQQTFDTEVEKEAAETLRILMREIRRLGGNPKNLVDSDLVDDLPADGEDIEAEAVDEGTTTFDNPESVLKAIQSREITREQGRQILIDDFGFREK